MRSGFKCSSYGRFKYVKRPRGNRYKDYSALCKCPSQKSWGDCMRMVPIWQHIVVLAVGLLQEFNDRVFIVNGCSSNTEHYKGKENKNVGKWWKELKVWRHVWKISKEWELTNELFSHLEEFICTLYGFKEKNVNKVQWLKIRDKHTKQNQVINMSALPPWKETLKLHSVRANFVAKI